ncbi:hypothetical protein L1987_34321 [Smallanthus sonchifolius]|uniref:Uncharacterized protein n=1 Tax=Smallanthus sonchifolius TaxID=185202 RepID=A0ACB9HUB4_9ASTR|nr:hypothetical protein L1987_34321 [Smallanthus sonchifolius]
MAAIASSLLYCSSYPPRARISCRSSSSPPVPQHGGRAVFMDFPHVSTSHKQLMIDLVSTVECRLGFLNPCSLPLDVQSYQNETGTAHAALLLRSGVQSSMIDFILGSWLHCQLPSGGALNITSMLAYLNSSTDAPIFVVELIQNSPSSMVLLLDLPPRKDITLNPDYLKTFYEDTQLDQHRQHFVKLSGVTPYVSPSLYDCDLGVHSNGTTRKNDRKSSV